MSTKNDPKTAASHSLSSLQFLDRTLEERCYFFSVLRSCRGTREASVRRAQKTRHACQGKRWKKCLFLSLRVCLACTVGSPHFHYAFDSRSPRVRHAIVSICLNFRFKYLSPGISPLNYVHMYIHVGLTSNGRINIQVSHCSLIK